MQVDDGAKAVPETILNAGEDWLTIIQGSQKEIPQDHWGIGATIKVRLDGDNLIISADEPGYSESTSVRIPALTTRAEPAADAVERHPMQGEVWSIIRRAMDTPHTASYEEDSAYKDAYASEAARKVIATLQADAVEPAADMVHAVHEALVNSAPGWIIDREDGELLDMARAALQAAANGTEGDE